ncbi:DUF3347 domain-containing protein [Mucilaginibacter aquariorum]|uniref:DUF3347 domain-containing protein n=1 Tax=Mucilaginibacter aquariorum TaxID=2967225 RepID=A0ABT1T409_9SPHI|nr:DUF3347 domain-containing protein [Mucilaginibacter aquariorum]MCQ6959257.1 DUF3347 domain-containing protein [Mucilaginibacter aquariorum]
MKKIQILIGAMIAIFSISSVSAQDNAPKKDAVLIAYYGVKNALISGDGAATSAKAKDLLAAITAFPADQLSAADKTNWTKYAAKLQFDARHIAENSNIAHQREHFASLSETLFATVKALKLNTAAVYWAYCPMKKTYWLSEAATIKNPYYGNEMLTCGEVKQTLPAAK